MLIKPSKHKMEHETFFGAVLAATEVAVIASNSFMLVDNLYYPYLLQWMHQHCKELLGGSTQAETPKANNFYMHSWFLQ
jgi:hypothetical protein